MWRASCRPCVRSRLKREPRSTDWIVERDALDAEEMRARESAQRVRQRIAQAEQDKERRSALDADAFGAPEKFVVELRELEEFVARQ